LWFNKKYGQTAYDSYQYRKDLFILVNGVPLISIEEKKYDKNLQPAFAQTIRYRES
jgi:type I site-specific restriction-modification system R (restriction) subunit